MPHLDIAIEEAYRAGKALLADAESCKRLDMLRADCINTLKAGKMIGVAGNGGSAAEAEHFVAELTGRFLVNRPGYPAINLNSNLAELTAISNDFGYNKSMLRNATTFSNLCGVYILLTTSGTSPNVLEVCEKIDGKVWVLTSKKCLEQRERWIYVPSNHTPTIQEIHLQILHWLAGAIEEEIKWKD